ncbi:MAG: cysteine--tRNA ligase [Proteobacteria bacterium]|nr:cysteine--tRNA ligase [Pseudomonadota bacterium]
MSLKLYNTATRKKETFTPIDAKDVRMYVCGPTVYDYAHIGNARPYIVFDVLYRLLRHEYGKDHVKYVRNITDVDDKINAAAAEQGVPISEITEKTTKVFHEDMRALGVLEPDVEPRATAHIPQMIAMIETLIAKRHAYVAEGHVLFDVPSMKDYGALSGRNRDEQIAGARVEVAPYKQDPADFVLWKPSTSDQPGWDSPWGRGRPGWHLECSAMSKKYLGETFDIHAGGVDLVFPHHENEIAQSSCAHGGAPLANVWMHNGYLTLEGEKMSKSLGNVVTVAELLRKVGANRGEAIRFNMLGTHYRHPVDWTDAGLVVAKSKMDKHYRVLERLNDVEPADLGGSNEKDYVLEALEDDLNTPMALSALSAIAEDEHRTKSSEERRILKAKLLAAGALLGLLQRDPDGWFKEKVSLVGAELRSAAGEPTISIQSYTDPQEIENLIKDRNEARKAKDFATSDRIRDELKEGGVILEDKPDGTTDWRRA